MKRCWEVMADKLSKSRLELGLRRSPGDGVAAKADFSNFLRNLAPDFLQYFNRDQKTLTRRRHNEESNCHPCLLRADCAAGICAASETNNNYHESVTVTGTVVKITTEEGAAASYQPAKTLVVRADGSNNPGSYVLKGPGHVVNKAGEVIKTTIKPGARVRVYYANMGDSRVVDHAGF